VASVSIIMDKYSGRGKGFGFIEMSSQPEGKAAIIALNDKTPGHMTISVVEALPLSDKKKAISLNPYSRMNHSLASSIA